jgi:hypothetical protein
MKGQRKPTRRAIVRRATTRRKKPRITHSTQTLMKVSSGDGLRSWVTLRLPAWLLVGVLVLAALVLLAWVFTPEWAAKTLAGIYELLRLLAGPQKKP